MPKTWQEKAIVCIKKWRKTSKATSLSIYDNVCLLPQLLACLSPEYHHRWQYELLHIGKFSKFLLKKVQFIEMHSGKFSKLLLNFLWSLEVSKITDDNMKSCTVGSFPNFFWTSCVLTTTVEWKFRSLVKIQVCSISKMLCTMGNFPKSA